MRPSRTQAALFLALAFLLLQLAGGTPALAQADDMDERITLGRFPILLEQVRDRIRIPNSGPDLPSLSTAEGFEGQVSMWNLQDQVALQFLWHTRQACARASTPRANREIACRYRDATVVSIFYGTGTPPRQLDAAGISARNEALSAVISPWWLAACTRGPTQVPICGPNE